MVALKWTTILCCLSLFCAVTGQTETIVGSGNRIDVSRTVSHFNQIAISGAGTLNIRQSGHESLVIHCDDNIAPHIQSSIDNGVLQLGPRNVSIQPSAPIRYDLTLKALSGLDASGAITIRCKPLQTENLRIRLSGAGECDIENLTARSLQIDMSGASDAQIAGGRIDRQRIGISGAGEYNAPTLESKLADIRLQGSACARIRATEQLSVQIYGSGTVLYDGSPQIDSNIAGTGEIKRLKH